MAEEKKLSAFERYLTLWVVLSTAGGKVIRFPAAQVSTFSRYARGVRLIQVEPGDRVVSAVVV